MNITLSSALRSAITYLEKHHQLSVGLIIALVILMVASLGAFLKWKDERAKKRKERDPDNWIGI